MSNVIAVSRDITARRVAEEKIEYLAFHDPLTDLPNRRLLKERLQQAVKQAERNRSKVGVLFLDCDNFKRINDTFGHEAEDEVLRHFAIKLKQSVRSADTVARFAGDEFAVIVPEVSAAEGAERVASRILEAIRSPWALNGCEISLSTSIGISLYPECGDNYTSLLRASDHAMYDAKTAGGNQFRYSPATGRRLDAP